MPACLYIVATPIGHLDDITLRALEVLKAAHCIAAEDTRHSAKLMRHFGIDTPMVSYHDHSPAAHTERLLRHLQEGKSSSNKPRLTKPWGHYWARAQVINAFNLSSGHLIFRLMREVAAGVILSVSLCSPRIPSRLGPGDPCWSFI